MTNISSDPKSAKLSKPPRRKANADVRAREFLTKDEVKAIIKAAHVGRYPDRDALAVLMCYRHALRATELVSLEWAHIDWHRKTILIKRVKNGVQSVHFLGPDEVKALRKLQRDEDGDKRWLFTTERKGPLSERTFHNIVAKASIAAELPFPVHPHMLRHAKGYQLAGEGTDTRAIQAYMGHKNIANTAIYTQLDPTRFRNFSRDL
ncbi:MAG: tyrosine-type recombinase/integrase [Candidatus Obscuribacterales bacterium]|nr:tyrosine-type recombinase/integrase [Candidatus Obscuribacterales bacterium]